MLPEINSVTIIVLWNKARTFCKTNPLRFDLSPEKLRQTRQVFTFLFFNDKMTKTQNFQVPNGFFWSNCKFYHQVVCLSFSGERLYLRGLRGFILQKVRA